MTIFLILSVVLLSFANGANDNFKGVATLWGSGLTTYQRAIAWGTGFTFCLQSKMQLKFTSEPLGDQQDRAAFSCGVEGLDLYLKKQAGQDRRRRAAVPFVATTDGKTVAAYYMLSQYAIHLDSVPDAIAKKLPKYPIVSATLLGRLAVATNFRGQRSGKHC
jgi:hypothetical protein